MNTCLKYKIVWYLYDAVPEAPQMEDLLPVYSYDLKELQSVKILLTVSCHAVSSYMIAYNCNDCMFFI